MLFRSGISSLSNMVKLGSIATKTVGLYLFTTGLAVSTALIFGWALNLSDYDPDTLATIAEGNAESSVSVVAEGLRDTVLSIFPNNIFGAFIENNMLGIVFISILFGIALNLTDELTDAQKAALLSRLPDATEEDLVVGYEFIAQAQEKVGEGLEVADLTYNRSEGVKQFDALASFAGDGEFDGYHLEFQVSENNDA